MIRVRVVDDEPMARKGVIARLAHHPDVIIMGEHGDGPSALTALRTSPPDLVFMDIQMPGMSGLSVLAAIPLEKRPLSILLTAHESFAVQAFNLNAIDYLLKPVDDQRFLESLERAREMIHLRSLRTQGAPAIAPRGKPKAEKFSVRIGHRMVYVQAREVEWISADGDYATLHVGARSYMVRESLQTLAAKLDEQLFVRVHRSSIVRIDRVAELQPLTNRDAVIRLLDGTPIRASRTYIGNLLARLREADVLG
ncbi:LytR/AlgR family response regulator transcription factor [Pseudoxanthomonas sp.]|uniref:LytR/AlgR family response regulator transcription factor n=1 Tax=Pseudoxanthomonas sp. TaxID=1871049 RepID=UPI003F7FA526